MAAQFLRAVLVAALVAGAAPVAAQDPTSSCTTMGMTGQCNELGSITMASDVAINGEMQTISASIVVNNLYRDREVRQFLFSVRNVSVDGSSPVVVELVNFATSQGPVGVLRTENPGPNELNMWVDVLDVPVGTPIDLSVRVGATRQGGFKLETLAMPFDRAYKPIVGSDGRELSLFAFTFLSVDQPTAGGTGGTGLGSSLGRSLPGPDTAVAMAAVAGLALLVTRTPRQPRRPLRLFRRP